MIEKLRTTVLDQMVGNTPLLEIDLKYRGRDVRVFAKSEHMNLTGSIKDRMALHILKEGYRSGALSEGCVIAEATSGNTGISFSAMGRAFGHKVVIHMPDWMSRERIALIKSYGADIVLVSEDEGGFLGCIDRADELSSGGDPVFLPHQFSNTANTEAHYRSTGPEIWHQLEQHGLEPDAFVAGVGTGGTIMGTGKYLKEKRDAVRLFPVEPAESPTLSTGYKVGSHRIQGISDEFIPAIVHLDELDDIIAVHDGDAIIMAQKLAADLGLAVGISSGANFIAALRALEMLGGDAVVATVFCDSNKKYLSTDLFGEEPLRDEYLSKDVELLSYKTFGRLEGLGAEGAAS
ncbi:MAG: PLP-dependent cysteine synthase family protein [Acidobacteriota bacterium]|nr:MAG: PLP-dependent cysteine synthase family protein [Acidobacteriota bacterium]